MGEPSLQVRTQPPSDDLVHRHCLYRSGKGSSNFQRSGPKDMSLFWCGFPSLLLEICSSASSALHFLYLKFTILKPVDFFKGLLVFYVLFSVWFPSFKQVSSHEKQCFSYIVRAITVTEMFSLTCNSRPIVECVMGSENTG